MAKDRKASSQSANVPDSDIVFSPSVVSKLAEMGCPETRVRLKLRHLLQYLRDIEVNGDWDVVFGKADNVKALIAKVGRAQADFPNEWRVGTRVGYMASDKVAPGLVFLRRCHHGLGPLPDAKIEAKHASRNGNAVTEVELGFLVTRQSRGFRFTIYRFKEVEKSPPPSI